MTSIGVVGAGYVGLVSAACFAHLGHDVICADIDSVRVDALRNGACPIHEAGLAPLLNEGVESGRLQFVVGADAAVRSAEVVFLCLPTPSRPDGGADTSYVDAAIREIRSVLRSGAVVVTKSTVPVGTGDRLEELIGRSDVWVVSNPEFLREGAAVSDFLEPDRVVIGANDRASSAIVAELYAGLAVPIVATDRRSAEMIKYAANAFLATKLSFVNTIATLCEEVGADVGDVARGIGTDPRIGHRFLEAGPGYGGSCFPKDTLELVRLAESAGCSFDILRSAIAMNHEQFDRVVAKVAAPFVDGLEGKCVALLGLAFKAGTDDVRESPATHIGLRLLAGGARVVAHDPCATAPHELADALGFKQVATLEAALAVADAVLVVTEWPEYAVSASWLSVATKARVIVDARNLLDGAALAALGFDYASIGRPRRPRVDANLAHAGQRIA